MVMVPSGRRWALILMGVLLSWGAGHEAQALPLAAPGDLQLRHDLRVLQDAGVLQGPLSAWPVPLGNLYRQLRNQRREQALEPVTSASLTRVIGRLRRERDIGIQAGRVLFEVADNPLEIRTFQDTPREEAALNAGIGWMGNRFAAKLSASILSNPSDGDDLRLDGSYVAGISGNWMATFGKLDRWWGPSWNGSLILSNNARPPTTIGIQRSALKAFELPILRWLGPWDLRAFIGQLDDDRVVSDAKLLGVRFAFQPFSTLEIGINRTAQWGGDGRPQDLQSFIDLVAGRDNVGEGGITEENQPGNQLASVDFRWRSPLGRAPYAIYGEILGEDEAGIDAIGLPLPSRVIASAGTQIWGSVPFAEASYRGYVEYTNTTSEFHSDENRPNFAYNHGTYEDGYRFHNRTLGHSIDGDSRAIAAGLLWVGDSSEWFVNVLDARLNKDGTDSAPPGAPHPLSPGTSTDFQRLYLSHRRGVFDGELTVGIAGIRSRPDSGAWETDTQTFIRYQR